MYGWIQIWLQKDYLGLIVQRKKKIQNSSHKCMKWKKAKNSVACCMKAWLWKYETTPPCFLTSVLGNIFTWRHRDATQCVISCRKKVIFSFRNSISSLLRLLMDIELALFIEMWPKVSFFDQCTKMQLITLQHSNLF